MRPMTSGTTSGSRQRSICSTFGSSEPTSTDTPRGCALSLPNSRSNGVRTVRRKSRLMENTKPASNSPCPNASTVSMPKAAPMRTRFYYTTQPIENTNLEALQFNLKMINAEKTLMFASDFPHWDFNLPSTIYDLPFLSEQAKRNILGETARDVYNLDV